MRDISARERSADPTRCGAATQAIAGQHSADWANFAHEEVPLRGESIPPAGTPQRIYGYYRSKPRDEYRPVVRRIMVVQRARVFGGGYGNKKLDSRKMLTGARASKRRRLEGR